VLFAETPHGFAFERVKALGPGQEFVEIDLQAVELRAVHAGKGHLATHCHPAPAAHACASTMMGFRLTMVLTLRGLVTATQAFIMMAGPMASTSSTSDSCPALLAAAR